MSLNSIISQARKKNEMKFFNCLQICPSVFYSNTLPRNMGFLFSHFPLGGKSMIIHLSTENNRFVNASKHFLLSNLFPPEDILIN